MAASTLILFAALHGSALAADQQPLKDQLTMLRIWNSELLKSEPSLVNVEAAITGDCRSKAPTGVNFVDYCSCARALVMKLWLSGIDPAMVQRINAFVADPKSTNPSDFLRYQGPELYQPFCHAATVADG
jgi:hypothetical protein